MRKVLLIAIVAMLCVCVYARPRNRFIFVERRGVSGPPPVAPTNYIARWEMNNTDITNTFPDESGNGLSVTNRQVVPDAYAKWFSVGDTNASVGYVEIVSTANNYLGGPDDKSLDFADGQSRSYGCWVRTTSGAGSFPGIFGKGDVSGGNLSSMTLDSGASYICSSFIRSGATLQAVQIGVVTNGDWHHVFVTRDEGSETTIGYLDGVATATNVTALGDTTNALPFLIGARSGVASFDGDIDDVMIFDSVINATQVSNLVASNTVPTNNMLAFYTFTNDVIRSYATLLSPETVGLDVHYGASTAPVATNAALKFDGVDDYASADQSYSMTTSASISVWVNADVFTAANMVLGFADNGTARGELQVGGNYGAGNYEPYGITFAVASADAVMVSSVSNSFPASFTGSWHNVIISWDTNDAAIYVDGSAVGIFTNTFNETLGTITDFDVGHRAHDGFGNWDGFIDDVELYDHRLTADEAAGIYAGDRSQ